MSKQEEVLDSPLVNGDDSPVDVEANVETAGEMLRDARLKTGLSYREVADKLHILANQVEALESNNYAVFSAEVFCKGYMRSYAKLMELDSELVIARYMKLRVEPVNVDAKKDASYRKKVPQGNTVKYWFLAASIVILFFLWRSSNTAVDDTTVAPVTSDKVIIDQNDNVVIVARNAQINSEDRSSIDAVSDVTANLELVNKSVEITNTDSVPANNVMAVADDNFRVGLGATEGSDKKEDLLTFLFEKDCWVEVKDSDDQLIFSALKRAEDSLTLSGQAPFSILLGYAPGVTLSHNGEPVEINVNRSNNSARLVVDRS